MAQQTINIGAVPNDGTGTPARSVFGMINANFTEVYSQLGDRQPLSENLTALAGLTASPNALIGYDVNGKAYKLGMPQFFLDMMAVNDKPSVRAVLNVSSRDDFPLATNFTGTALSNAVRDGSFITVPAGTTLPTLPAAYNSFIDYTGSDNSINVYQATGETTRFSKRVFKSQLPASHQGSEYSVFTVEGKARGSGYNGPSNADYGFTLSLQKLGFADGTAANGEIDGMNIVVRQAGTASDATCWLGNVAHYGTGFTAVFEAQSSNIVNNAIQNQMQIQGGAIDNVNNIKVGFFCNSTVGALDDAFRADNSAGASWKNFFTGLKDGIERFKVDSNGYITLKDSSGNSKAMGVNAGYFRILNNAQTAELFTLTDAGVANFAGPLGSTELRVGGVKVVGSPNAGWVAMTGAGNKNTAYDTSSITLVQLAQRVNSIQAALTAHGLLSA